MGAGAHAVELLWPGGAPGWEDVPDRETVVNRDVEQNAQGLNRAVSRVSRPSIALYLPPAERATGAAVLLLPGGGFQHLAIDKEGYDVATWLTSLGVAGVVIAYRLDAADRRTAIGAALEDTRRAIRLVRSRSDAWQIDPRRIGLLGFSAGGHLAASVATAWDRGRTDAADPVERVSCRPDHVGLLYAPIPREAYAGIGADTPPVFLAQAADDFVSVADTLRFYGALHEAKVRAELHVYAAGGHGFGLGVRGGPVASWPGLYAAWLGALGGGG